MLKQKIKKRSSQSHVQVMWVFPKQNLAPGLGIGGGFSMLHENTIPTKFLNLCHQPPSAKLLINLKKTQTNL